MADATKRWSLPVRPTTQQRPKRLSMQLKNESYDSETDIFQSDQEEELLKLLDYSSQDDDISPSVFHDNCEEVITYIENLMHSPVKSRKNDDLNERYNLAARNSLLDMDWRVLKYGENIFLGEIMKLVDLLIDVYDKNEKSRKRDLLQRLKANSDLDNEMKRLSQVIEDLDEIEPHETNKEVVTTNNTINTTIPAKRPTSNDIRAKLEDKKHKLKSPIFKIKKVKPVNLVINIDMAKSLEMKSVEPLKEEKQKGESTEVVIQPDVIVKDVKTEFWQMFKDDSEWWQALAKRNLKKMEETRRELERFSGHELVLEEFHNEINKYENEKQRLQSFIDDVDRSKAVNVDLEYDKKYEDMVLKLIAFAKKDFIYKGFDPLIEQLKALSNIQIEGRKKKVVNIQDIINIYTQIDITKYSYEELCLLEKYYKEIIRKYKKDTHVRIQDKENIAPKDRYPSRTRDDTQSAPPSYHRSVILNVNSTENLTKNINRYSTTSLTNGETKQSKSNNRNSQVEIFDLTRTYPIEYYANNWWTIYEDILKSREQQFGTIDNWWHFYETILNKEDTNDEELKRLKAVVQYRNSLRKPRTNSRLEEQLKMLDEVKKSHFKETEDVKTADRESVRVLVFIIVKLTALRHSTAWCYIGVWIHRSFGCRFYFLIFISFRAVWCVKHS